MNLSTIAKFLTVSKIEPISWTCSIGCSHTRNKIHYRWYWKLCRQLYYYIRRKLGIDKNFFPLFKNKKVYPCLFNSKDIVGGVIPMTEPTGLKFVLRYVYDNKDKKPLDNNLGEARD